MGATMKQANFLLPEDLLDELKASTSKRQQSKFIAEALRQELKRKKLEKTLQTSFGAWKIQEHPELQSGVGAFVRKLRKSTRDSKTK